MRLFILLSSAFLLNYSVTLAEVTATPCLSRQFARTDTVIPRKANATSNSMSQQDLKPMILPGTMLDTTFSSLPAQPSAVGKAVPSWLRTSVQGTPLYVIDGQSATANQLKSLKRQEVVSTYQMEGQKAKNLYGKHARNGVFIITTRSGIAPK
jgi:hypothetical protein